MLRVTTTTILLSLVVVGLLGMLLMSRVTSGLLSSKERSSIAEATAGLNEAQRILDAADTGPTTPSPARLVDTVVSALAARAGSPVQFDVLLLSGGDAVDAPERGTNLVAVTSVPPDLRAAVSSSGRQAWTFTEISYLDGRTVPGLAVGAPLNVPTVGLYELYYLFPLTQEQLTVDLVRGAVFGTAILLVLLVGTIALLVTRWVVAPVRAAARTAEQFSEGHLQERMKVKGEDDLAALATSFNEMAGSLETQINALESLSRVQQRFVSDVSHELRTPLTTIRMAADVIAESKDSFDPATARSAELLQNQLDRFELLLSDLLEISRYDAGAAMLELDPVDLAALSERVISQSLPLAKTYGTAVRLHLHDDDSIAMCDSRRVDRILRNLLDNAIEHSEGRPIDVSVASSEDCVAITVRDHGVGLRPGEASLVFNRFWRADPARARTTGGTGLGLAIALSDAKLHGGWLQAWGEPGAGACFRLTLPRNEHSVFTEAPLPLVPDDFDLDAAWSSNSVYSNRSRGDS